MGRLGDSPGVVAEGESERGHVLEMKTSRVWQKEISTIRGGERVACQILYWSSIGRLGKKGNVASGGCRVEGHLDLTEDSIIGTDA